MSNLFDCKSCNIAYTFNSAKQCIRNIVYQCTLCALPIFTEKTNTSIPLAELKSLIMFSVIMGVKECK